MNSFINEYQSILYYFWLLLLILRVIVNQIAFDGDPDIDMSGFKSDWPPMILLIFTFFWEIYEEDSRQVKSAKIFANRLSKIFILTTIFVIIVWCYLVSLKM